MTDESWYKAAEHFGLTREEADAHRQAWEDRRRLHAGPFCVETVKELYAALSETQQTEQPVNPETWRRLSARSLIIQEMAAAAEHNLTEEFLRDYKGPAH
jgi:hypothetical protein